MLFNIFIINFGFGMLFKYSIIFNIASSVHTIISSTWKTTPGSICVIFTLTNYFVTQVYVCIHMYVYVYVCIYIYGR